MEEKQRQSILVLFSLLFVLLAVYYFLYYQPAVREKEQAEVRVETLKSKVSALSSRQKQTDGKPPQEQVQKIAERIPVEPYTDQLVLDLGNLQSVGRVRIVNVSFEEGKDVNVKQLAALFGTPLANEQGDKKTSLEEKLDVTEKKEAASVKNDVKPSVNVQAVEQALPSETLKAVEMKLTVKGNYSDIYTFVNELQNISRYLRVDELSFTSPRKDDFVIPKDQQLNASLKLTSYYAPQYAPLLDKKPEPVVPAAAGKKDPTVE